MKSIHDLQQEVQDLKLEVKDLTALRMNVIALLKLRPRADGKITTEDITAALTAVLNKVKKIPDMVHIHDASGDYVGIYHDDKKVHWYHHPQLSQIYGWLGIPVQRGQDITDGMCQRDWIPESHKELDEEFERIKTQQLDEQITKAQAELALLNEQRAKIGARRG